VLLATSDKQWYLAELAQALDKSSSSLQRELESLVGVGLLTRRVVGRRVYFQANAHSPFFKVLREMFAGQTTRKGRVAGQFQGTAQQSSVING
jgi:DNA-binding IclR family transcriptional regulator